MVSGFQLANAMLGVVLNSKSRVDLSARALALKGNGAAESYSHLNILRRTSLAAMSSAISGDSPGAETHKYYRVLF